MGMSAEGRADLALALCLSRDSDFRRSRLWSSRSSALMLTDDAAATREGKHWLFGPRLEMPILREDQSVQAQSSGRYAKATKETCSGPSAYRADEWRTKCPS